MSRNKSIIIPDRTYHKIWSSSLEYDSLDIFVSNFRNSKEFRKLIETGCSFNLIIDLLSITYEFSHISIKDLLTLYNIKNATLSHRLCIPIKTIEGWKSSGFKCPSYVKLMIIRTFGIKYLPTGICIESFYTSSANTSSFTSSTKSKSILTSKDSIIHKSNDDSIKIQENTHFSVEDSSIDVYNEKEGFPYSKPFSLREFEQTHLLSNDDFLSSTDYLGDILKSRKNKN